MTRTTVALARVPAACAAALVASLLLPSTAHTQGLAPTLEAADAALGATATQSLRITGHGADYLFGQAYDGNSPWPRFSLPRISLTFDFASRSLRDERIRTQGQSPPLGGGNQPVVGEQQQVWVLSGPYAWNERGSASTPAGLERDGRTAVAGRQAQLLLTPHGFIREAIARKATLRAVRVGDAQKSVVAFQAADGARFEGVLGPDGLVEQIDTWVGSPLLGDTLFEAVFTEYRQFGAIRFPTHIVQREAGYPVLDLRVEDVTVNPAVRFEVPESVRTPRPQPRAPFAIQPLSDWVWTVALGPRDHSFVLEFRDHLVVIEAPESEAVSTGAIAAITQRFPAKPIRAIVNTHTHFDHSGGLRTYAAAGAIVVTHRDNVPYYQEAWSRPRTLVPDQLSRSGRTPAFEGIVGNRVLSDGERVAVIYHYAGNLHHPGMLMVYLPRERMVIEADSFNPQNDPREPPTAIPNLVQFYDTLNRLKLEVQQVVPIHGRIATFDEGRRFIEQFAEVQLWK